MSDTESTDRHHGAAAFAALDAIVEGDWDRYLLRLRAACNQRMKTEEYQANMMSIPLCAPRRDASTRTRQRGTDE